MKKKLIIVVGAIGVLLLVGVVAGFIFLGPIVKTGVEQVGPMITKTPMKLEGAAISVFNGSGELKGFELGNPEGFKTPHAIRAGRVGVAVSPGSVFSDKVVVRSVRVIDPEITFETDLKGNNLSAILANVQSVAGAGSDKPAEKTSGAAKKLQVDEFLITGGKIHLSATLLGGKSATLPLPEIRLSNLGEGPEGITPAELTEKVLASVTKGTLKAVADGASALGKEGAELAKKAAGESVEAVKKVGGEAVKSIEKIGSGIGDMFKKK